MTRIKVNIHSKFMIIFIMIFSITVVQYTYLMYLIISSIWIILLDQPLYGNLLNVKDVYGDKL